MRSSADCHEQECPGEAGFVPANSARASMKTFMGCQRRADELEFALRGLMFFTLEDYFPECATPDFKAAVEKAAGVLEIDLAAEVAKRREA